MADRESASLEQFLNPAWMKDAACKGKDLQPFFSTKSADKDSATKICSICPVKGECLDYALVFDLSGTWGGLTELQRTRMYKDEHRTWLRDEYFGEQAS